MKEISILAPATVANVVCGFDCLGFALHEPNDEMTVRIIDEKTVRVIHRDNYNLPFEAEQNVAGKVLLAMLDAVEEKIGFEVKITKHIKPGSGIGSSSASAVGAAANKLLGNRFSRLEVAEFALVGEQLASQGRHADNAHFRFGPSVFMLSETLQTARKVENAMKTIYEQTEIDFNIYVSEINAEGVKSI